jgi:cation:H+ antiporter
MHNNLGSIILLLVIGFVILVKGADWLVNGSSSLARRFNISNLAIGLTLVAFGTSAPEFVVSIIASFQNHPEIILGNVIGSNNFNVFIILGIAGLISPLVVHSSTVWKEIPVSMLAVIMLFLLSTDIFGIGNRLLSRIDGVIFLLLFGLFLFYVIKQISHDPVKQDSRQPFYSVSKVCILILAGLAGLIIGGKMVVDNAVELAGIIGMSEKLIGLTIVAAGTSLPELATSVVAVIRKNTDIAVGNIIGSNIFNVFFILGVTVLLRPIEYQPAFNIDLSLLGVGTVLLFIAMFTGKTKRLDRWEASILLLIYLVYSGFILAKEF